MIIANLACGLGNQLFQYAMGRRLATKLGTTLTLDLSWFDQPQNVPGLETFPRDYRLNAFHIDARPATSAELAPFIHRKTAKFSPRWFVRKLDRLRRRIPLLCRGMVVAERHHRFEPALRHLCDGVYLHGWWQSEGYFRDHAGQIRRELTLRDSALVAASAEYVHRRRQPGKPVVSVHVRRGDVARAHEILQDLTHMPYELVSADYLRAAMARFGPHATFLVFSDTSADLEWCRQHLRADDIHFAADHSDLLDFAIMSHCDHHVISNSSFGWWAAWLNPHPDKLVVAPRRWFRREYAPDHDIHSLVPPEWAIL